MRFSHLILALSFSIVLATGGLAYWGYVFYRSEFPQVGQLKTQFPVVRYRGPKQPFTVALQRQRPPGWASLGEISRAAVGAVIVSEDWAFYQHKGYDAAQIKEAIQEDVAEGKFARGASTITQQVVKNVFLERDKNLWRKVKELVLAVRVEESVGKRKILETYLNVAEWGEGIFGIRAAARHYFQKAPSELTPREGAFLAMLLPSPKRYSQSFRRRELTRYARGTVNRILRKMVQARYITEEELARELVARLAFEKADEPLTPPDATVVPEGDLKMTPEEAGEDVPDLTEPERSGDNHSL
jgi:monofunctional biosynthetic peptidoglycan transglycosylase